MKLTRFEDVPQYTREGSWECDFSVTSVFDFLRSQERNEGIDLDPDFQRAHVWTEAQQVAWLEFFLKGGKTGRVIYFNHAGWMKSFKTDRLTIVDGKQRLEAMRRFVHNEIRVFGSYFHEYTDSLRINRTIKINVNTLQTRAEVLRWYLEFNAGGTPHTEQEIERVRKLLDAEQRTPEGDDASKA